MDPLRNQQDEKLKNELQLIDIPDTQLEQTMVLAYKQYRKERRKKQRLTQAIIVLAVMLIAFPVGIRMSPAFANAAAQIPGLEPLVKLIVTDKGLDDIIKNDYVEMLHLTATNNNFQFTLLSAIADETGLVLSYELQRTQPFSNIQVKDVELRQNGQPVPVGITMPGNELAETTNIQNTLEFILHNDNSFNGSAFELFIQFDDASQTQFTIPFQLSRPIQQSKQYTMNKPLKIDNQTVIVEALAISPLRAKLTLAIPNENTEQLLQFGTVTLMDEKGEEWGKILNGVVGEGDIRDGKVSIYIQSNYFRTPSSLTLSIENIEALPKGEDYFVVDFQQQKIVQQPKILDIQLEVASKQSINAIYPTAEQHHVRPLLGEMIDARNNVFYMNEASHHTSEEDFLVHGFYHYDTRSIENPVKINIASYPRYLKGKIELTIPVD